MAAPKRHAAQGAKRVLDELIDTSNNVDEAADAAKHAEPVVAPRSEFPQGNTAVCQSVDEAGNVEHVGITDDLERRAAEHLRDKGIEIDAIPGLQGLDRDAGRAVEQVLIEAFGLGRNGGSLLNKINSIAKKNPFYGEAITLGRSILGAVGFPGF